MKLRGLLKEFMGPISFYRRAVMVVFLFLLFFGASLALDNILLGGKVSYTETYDRAVGVDPANGTLPPPYPLNERRMFILLVDCLAYPTALDAELMPNLNDLRETTTHGYVQNAVDAITAPSLKAMFTGKDTVSIFGASQNWIAEQKVSSVLTQLNEVNVTVSVYSNHPFEQFGDDITDYNYVDRIWDIYPELEKEAIDESIDDYMNRDNDIVIMHLLTPHDANHYYGPGTPQYYHAFEEADKVIGRLAVLLEENDTLLVTGDHGHDVDGRHSFGVNAPTFFAIRGQGFKKNHDVSIAITDMRYFISWAMGVPLPDEYDAGKFPSALESRGPLPESFATENNESIVYTPEVIKVGRGSMILYSAVTIYVFMLIIFWYVMTKDGGENKLAARLLDAGGLLALVPLFIFTDNTWLLGAGGLFVALLASLGVSKEVFTKKELARALWILPFGIFFIMFGYILIRFWEHIFYFDRYYHYMIWGVLAVIGVFIANKKGVWPAVWCITIPTMFLLIPTIYGKGWVGIMGPVLICFSLFLLWEDLLRPLFKRGEKEMKGGGNLMSKILMLAPIIFTGVIFFNHKGVNFHFEWWYGILFLLPHVFLVVSGVIGKIIVFFRPGKKYYTYFILGPVLLFVYLYELGHLRPHPYVTVALIIILGTMGWLMGSRKGDQIGFIKKMGQSPRVYLSFGLAVASLSLLYYYSSRGDPDRFLWSDLLTGALVLGAYYIRKYRDPSERRTGYVFLMLVGFIAAGWVSMSWTPTDLEWFYLFDWIPYVLLEAEVIYFIPFIVLKYLVPLILIRFILGRILLKGGGESNVRNVSGVEVEPKKPGPGKMNTADVARPVLSIIGLRAAAVIFIFFGIALYGASGFFFGAVQQAALMLVLMLALI